MMDRRIGLMLDVSTEERIAALLARLQADSAGQRVTKSDVARMCLLRGLAEAEADHG